jgi:outer membrane beta-barrel protein
LTIGKKIDWLRRATMDGGPMLLSLLLSLAFWSSPNALANSPQEIPENEYDFSWLDPEKKIYVVQNRKYLKSNRVELAFSGGFGFGEPYRSRTTLLPRAFFYFSEQWGVSVFAGFNANQENETAKALRSVSSVFPAVRDVQNFYGGSILWLPFYGKINMFNQILYIDWHLEVGVGQVDSEIDLNTNRTQSPILQESTHFSVHWGTGQKFFITRNWAARLEFLAQYYRAPTGIDGSVTTPSGSVEDTYDNYYVTLGLSYTF